MSVNSWMKNLFDCAFRWGNCSGGSKNCDVTNDRIINVLLFDRIMNNGEANSCDCACKFFFVIERLDEITFNIISGDALYIMSGFDFFKGIFIG